MSTNEKDTKESTEVIPGRPAGSLLAFDEFDTFYVVTVNAPGADQSSLVVNLEDQILHISIKTERAEAQTDEKNGQYSFRERFMGEFHRTLTLPGPADAAKMKTDYRNGVLTITIDHDRLSRYDVSGNALRRLVNGCR